MTIPLSKKNLAKMYMILTLEERCTRDCPWLNETGGNRNFFTLGLETGTLWIRLFGMLRLYPFLEHRLGMQS